MKPDNETKQRIKGKKTKKLFQKEKRVEKI